jgi:CDP-paratose 2-epimerase
MKTVCFRCGCITGRAQKGVEQHGFLNYLAKCVKEERPYTIYGFEGKLVRDNLHALDVAKAIEIFHQNPKSGAVYDLGGGKENTCTLLESIESIEKRLNKKLQTKFGPARKGDFENWITDISAFQNDYDWSPSISLDQFFDELVGCDLLPQ